MRVLRQRLRRAAGGGAAVLLGTVAALAFASPAFAHHTAIEGTPVCDTATGEWVVSWSVVSAGNWAPQYKLIHVGAEPAGSTLTGLPTDTFQDWNVPFTGEQRLAGDETSATLTVQGKWSNEVQEERRSKTVEFGEECQEDQPKPTASAESRCDGTVIVKLDNAEDATKAADFVVTGTGGFSEPKSVAPGGSATVTVPASAAGDIAVKVKDQLVGEFEWTEPEDCAPLNVASRSECDSLTVVLENPEGNRTITAKVTSGETTEDVSVPPGEMKEITFPATDGTSASVLISGENEPVTVTWENPGDCTTPPPPPDLPVTGTNVGGALGIGAALVAIGAAVIFMLRRRRASNAL